MLARMSPFLIVPAVGFIATLAALVLLILDWVLSGLEDPFDAEEEMA